MTIIELRAKRNKAWEAAKEFAETHRTPAGTLSAEDEATYNALEKQIMDYGREIQRMERQEAIDAELAKPVTAPITGRPGNQQEEKKTGRASDEYRQAVLAALRSNFRKVSNVLSEGVDAQGGYLVPEEYDRRLIDVLTEENIMRNLGTKITTSGEHMNPTNVGAIIRSAAALGMDAVILTPGCSDPLYRRAARVSMGTVFQIEWTFLTDDSLDEIKALGFKTVAMALKDNSLSINDPRLTNEKKLAIIMGTEGDGLSDQTISECDFTVKIPMYHGVDSLNVAAASAVAFYQLGNKQNDV